MIPNQPPNPADGETGPPEGARLPSSHLVSRRALVRAGWTLPVVMALHIPPNALAQYACTHSDVPATAHVDVAAEAHTDVPATAHIDSGPPAPGQFHNDVPATLHLDVPAKAHVDVPAAAHVDSQVCA